jgi:antitoxin (DNA-binding transcriptional repressor) of toxin-antitoxin stability system
MVEVGVRELRDHLSKHLADVQSGVEIVVTERGHAIARLVPLHGERTIDRLVREGLVTPARRRGARLPKPLSTAGSVSDLVAEQHR